MMAKTASRLLSAAILTIWAISFPALAEVPRAEGLALSGSYLAGRSADKGRDNDTAIEYISKALERDPRNPALVEKLFILELSSGDMASAQSLADRVLTFNSQQRMARIVLGLRDFRNGSHAAARQHFAEASYTPVGELTSVLATAWAYAGEGNLNEALKTLDRLDSNDSFANFKAYHGGLIADLLANDIRAEGSYKKAYEQAGTSLRVVQAYGNFLERNNRRDEAIKAYETFVGGGDTNILIDRTLKAARAGEVPKPFVASAVAGLSEAMFSLASAMTDEQSIDVALLYVQLALSLEGDRPVNLTLLGDIYVDTQQYEKAIEAYRSMPADSPLRTNAEIEIAINLQRLEKSKEAQAKLEDIISRNADNYDAWVTLGNVQRTNENYPAATEAYSKALELVDTLEKNHWRILYYRGIGYERQKIWDKAEADFRKALSLSPDEPLVLNYLGYSLIEKKMNLTEALNMVKKAVELKPNDGYVVDSLGWAYYQLGDYEEAVRHLERAVELNPADPIIGEHLGDAYWQVDRRLEAKFKWQHAKDNDPEPEDLVRIEEKLRNGLAPLPVTTPVENSSGNTRG